MKKKWTSALLAVTLATTPIVGSMTVEAKELTGLTLEAEMRAMVDRGVIKGMSNGKVMPKADVRRSDFAAFAARLLALPPADPTFQDVNQSMAVGKEIGAIERAGYMTGDNKGHFRPNDVMTREEMAVTLQRIAKDLQLKPTDNRKMTVRDASRFSLKEGVESAQYVAALGIMNGLSMNTNRTVMTFEPKAPSKRDQVAAVLYRLSLLMDGKEIERPTELNKPAPLPDLPKPPKPTPPPVVKPDAEDKPTTPPIAQGKYQLALLQSGKFVPSRTTYSTYDAAVQALNSNRQALGVYESGQLVRIQGGVAYANNAKARTTIIYTDPTFKKQLTYVQYGRELALSRQTKDYVAVQVGDQIGYVKPSDIGLIPTALTKGNDYYAVNNARQLVHYTFDHVTNRYAGYTIGPAPQFLQAGQRYRSVDGVHFRTPNNQLVGTHYPYFQFLNMRTTTNYSAAELDRWIMQILAEREKLNSTYKDATKKSKLIGIGTYLKQVEAQHRVNALFILATAVHESNYGMSANAQQKNNLFGIRVFDSTPEAGSKYVVPERSVDAFIAQYMNKNYIVPKGAYAKGGAPGHKSIGFNVSYASDPDWGSKIAGHMYRIDSALGQKDDGTYRRAVTVPSTTLNVRAAASPTSNILYTYPAKPKGISGVSGYPVVITAQQKGSDGRLWYRILTDEMIPDGQGGYIEHGWIRGDFLRDI